MASSPRSLTLLMAALALVAAGCSGSPSAADDPATVASGKQPRCAYPVGGREPARPVDPPSTDRVPTTGTVTATLKMAAGTVTITMDRAKTPCTVHNFESLAAQQFFDHTTCHRLVDTGIFILQCGDPSATGTGGPGYSFADELTGKETYPRGTVAMANAGPDTNGSQFFLVWQDSPLDPNYTVFGHLDDASLNVVASIASQGVDGTDGVSPIADASITSVTLG
ncbi:peptidylprolyl isomerase [Aestuariimicrobium kwangyangense]|uniref:peptidylprolyl isomerase n=1 Tax=Aestuariimicrobium kwangyangense TaxID=396389 RepID=UPI0003B370C3|nr:peptidylprolyl isomerase [Aestuariimicrobium kwangyangense]